MFENVDFQALTDNVTIKIKNKNKKGLNIIPIHVVCTKIKLPLVFLKILQIVPVIN